MLWQDAIAEFGDVKVQAEALGYAAWAEVIEDTINGLLARVSGRPENGGPSSTAEMAEALRGRQAEFKHGEAGELRAQIINASKGRS